MGSNRFMVVSEKRGIIAMNPSYVEQIYLKRRMT